MLSDNDWIIYLETRKEKINTERKTKNYVNKASGNANFAKAGTQNLKKLTSDPKHQRKAGVKGAEAMRKINSQRLKDLLLYSLEVLPLEFTSDDLLSLYNNNQQNTLFHKSHKLNKPISFRNFKRKFLKESIDQELVVTIRNGNDFTYHNLTKVNNTVIDTMDNSIESTTDTNGQIKNKYYSNSTYSFNLIYI